MRYKFDFTQIFECWRNAFRLTNDDLRPLEVTGLKDLEATELLTAVRAYISTQAIAVFCTLVPGARRYR